VSRVFVLRYSSAAGHSTHTVTNLRHKGHRSDLESRRERIWRHHSTRVLIAPCVNEHDWLAATRKMRRSSLITGNRNTRERCGLTTACTGLASLAGEAWG